MRAFLLVFVIAATALVIWLLMSEAGPASRGGRARGVGAPLELPPKAAEEEGVRGPTKTPKTPAGRAFPLSGYVREPGGAPVPGAVVRVAFKGTFTSDVTDGHGAFAVEVSSPICTFDVWATGYLPLAGTVGGRSNGELDLVFDGEGPWKKDFTLKPAASLTGYVTDENGQPVKDARVYVIPADYALLDRETIANVVKSDGKGAFSFPGLPAGVTDLGARAQGFLPLIVRDLAIPERGTMRQDLRLVRGREILVAVINAPTEDDFDVEVAQDAFTEKNLIRVTAADSRLRSMLLPPGGADALSGALVGRSFAGLPVVDAARRDDGRFGLSGVGPGPADVEARVSDLVHGTGPTITRFGRVITEPGLGRKFDTTEPEVILTLVPAMLITVNVRDSVTATPLEPEVSRRTVGVATPLPVDRDKTSYLVPRDDRRHALVFTLDGYQEAGLDLPDLRQFAQDAPQRPSFDVAMLPTATGETGGFYVVFDPPLNGRVALVGRDDKGAQRWVKHIEDADKEGRWPVDEIPVGIYSVSILATGKVPALLPQVAITRGFKETHRVTLTEGGGLSLRVTDTGGQLLDQVHLLLKDQAGNQIDVHVLSQVSEGRAFLSVNYLPSAAAAKADSGLASGFYEITVYREGFDLGRRQFEVRGTDIAEVEIALPKAAAK